jgi:hypothetical protein
LSTIARQARRTIRLFNFEGENIAPSSSTRAPLQFNRMGFLAGFGPRNIRMVKSGVLRGEGNREDPRPRPFRQEVHAEGYTESWVEGMVVLHNPRARLPLDSGLIPGAAHEFFQADGRIMSLLPEFHPLFSQTEITLDRDEGGAVADGP